MVYCIYPRYSLMKGHWPYICKSCTCVVLNAKIRSIEFHHWGFAYVLLSSILALLRPCWGPIGALFSPVEAHSVSLSGWQLVWSAWPSWRQAVNQKASHIFAMKEQPSLGSLLEFRHLANIFPPHIHVYKCVHYVYKVYPAGGHVYACLACLKHNGPTNFAKLT